MEIENAVACQVVVLYRKPHGLSEKEVEESLFFRFHFQANPALTVGEVRSNAKQQFEKLYDLSVPTSQLQPGFLFSRFFDSFLCEMR
ncbi:hypothetical protein DSO57_1024820 [Entomophthora muscae]|uniref:Uncharacterized protein n=2 Tax=Entomophthora muscae TaxID=34485 RepID=A0ACC2TEL2_9FUNG|nr:hypothetical protein DSO57_1016564 [Entomophthora muscae]KAJ9072677.1 hypothetical protein DSO57_1024820 [Entomophthora muscae]